MANVLRIKNSRRQVPAVTRAIRILRQLGTANEPAGVNQIARELKLIPSTCLHILRVLTDEGLVAFDPISKRYTIDVGILTIARNAIRKNGFIGLINRQLVDLSSRFGLTGIATQIIDPDHIVVVAISQAPLPFQLQVDLGSRFPVLISASGMCYAAFTDIPQAELKTRFAKLNWDRTPKFQDWKAEVDETRLRGFAVDRGAFLAGVTVIAVPLFDQRNHMTHSMVAAGISEKIEAIGIPTIGKAMLAMRDEVGSLRVGVHIEAARQSKVLRRSKGQQ